MSTFTLDQFKKLTAAEQAVVLAELQAKRNVSLTVKMGNKGNFCIYGLQRYPYSFYKSQWTALKGIIAKVDQFIVDHASELADKAS